MLGAISYDPIVTIDLGPLEVSPHGIGIAVGFLIGSALFLPVTRRQGISDEVTYSMLTRAAIGSLLGARLAYVVNHFSEYDAPLDVLRVWEGGISLLGGIFGAIIAGVPRMRKAGLSFWAVMDAAAPGVALGIIIGRSGDLVVGDHLGKTTDFFLGYRCPPFDVETASPCAPTAFMTRTPGAIVHQTALYDLLLTTALLCLLLWLRRSARWDGLLITVFATWYATGRIIEDFLREDLRRFGLTGSQVTAAVTLTICGLWLVFGRRTPKWGRWDRPPPAGTGTAAPTMTGPLPETAGEE